MQFRVLGKPVFFIRVEEKLGFGKAMEKNANTNKRAPASFGRWGGGTAGRSKNTACPHVDVETCLMERYFQ